MLRDESESPKKDVRIEDSKIYFHFIFYLELRVNIMQRRAAIWILGAFKTSLVEGIKAITDLIPIKLHLQKLMGRL